MRRYEEKAHIELAQHNGREGEDERIFLILPEDRTGGQRAQEQERKLQKKPQIKKRRRTGLGGKEASSAYVGSEN